MKKNTLIIIEIIILLLGFGISSSIAIDTLNWISEPISNGNILYVGGSGPNNYTTIQHAINDASKGDTVFVFDDSSPYYENVVIDKSINLIGEEKSTTVIDARNLGNAILINNDNVNVSGFTVQNAAGIYAYQGIYIYKSNKNNIYNNIVQNNNGGIYLEESSINSISNNIIKSNNWGGIDLRDSCRNNVISNNYIMKNDGFGIDFDRDCNYNNLSKNTIFNNRNSAIAMKFSKGNIIQKNNFIYNKRAVFFSGLIGENNIWDQNYWNRPRLLPKIISGSKYFDYGRPPISYSWINIDWRPADKPYKILDGITIDILNDKVDNYSETITFIEGSFNDHKINKRGIVKDIEIFSGLEGKNIFISGFREAENGSGKEYFYEKNIQYIHAPQFFGLIHNSVRNHSDFGLFGFAFGEINWEK